MRIGLLTEHCRVGGCCPFGYTCNRSQNCIVPPGLTETAICPTGYRACPSQFNYGCCAEGLACAVNNCYATAPVTSLIPLTLTVTSADNVFTTTSISTTVSTPVPPKDTEPLNEDYYATKLYPTEIPKISSVRTSTGLGASQIGGIVGGVVGLLVIVIIVAVLVLRRLNKVAKLVESAQGSADGLKKPRRFTRSEVEAMEFDPLNTRGNTRPSTVRHGGTANHDRSKSTSEIGTDCSSSQQTTPFGGSHHHNTQPASPSPMASTGPHVRGSVDSSAGGPGGYFDQQPCGDPGRQNRASSQSGVPSGTSQSPYHGGRDNAWRHCSTGGVSDVSGDRPSPTAQPQFGPVELPDNRVYPELPGSTPSSPPQPQGETRHVPFSFGGRAANRHERAGSASSTSSSNRKHRANAGTATPQAATSAAAAATTASASTSPPPADPTRGRSESASTQASGMSSLSAAMAPHHQHQGGASAGSALGVLSEGSEMMTGFYGPPGRLSGQTAAGLMRRDTDPDEDRAT